MARVGEVARREKHEQQDGVRLLESLGARVFVSGTVRRKGDHPGTMQTPGIPDVEAFLPPPRYQSQPRPASRVLVKWEAKSPVRARAARGGLSTAQLEYRDLCRHAGVHHITGDLTALLTWLVREGYLRADQVPAHRHAEATARE